jgi:hypothetical protein
MLFTKQAFKALTVKIVYFRFQRIRPLIVVVMTEGISYETVLQIIQFQR